MWPLHFAVNSFPRVIFNTTTIFGYIQSGLSHLYDCWWVKEHASQCWCRWAEAEDAQGSQAAHKTAGTLALGKRLLDFFIFFYSAFARKTCDGISQSLRVRIPRGKMLSNAKQSVWAKVASAGAVLGLKGEPATRPFPGAVQEGRARCTQ